MATRISGEPGGVGEFVVKSASIDGIAWVVEIQTGRRIKCPCTGYQVRSTCRHAEAVRKARDAEPRPTLEDQLERSLAAERSKRTRELLRN